MGSLTVVVILGAVVARFAYIQRKQSLKRQRMDRHVREVVLKQLYAQGGTMDGVELHNKLEKIFQQVAWHNRSQLIRVLDGMEVDDLIDSDVKKTSRDAFLAANVECGLKTIPLDWQEYRLTRKGYEEAGRSQDQQ